MRIVRYSIDDRIYYGILEGDRIQVIQGAPYESCRLTGEQHDLTRAKLLAPSVPSKIVCIGLNYLDHAREFQASQLPLEPILFLKPPSAVVAHEDRVKYPNTVQQLDPEAELAVIIKKTIRCCSTADALEAVLGYTCGNDFTARDLQRKDGQWTRAKSFDTFCPLGPWIETSHFPEGTRITLKVNGSIRQSASTAEMIFPVPVLINYISNIMTLHPGDVIMTGTPAGVGPVECGDWVEVEIEGIGSLSNVVQADEAQNIR